MPRDDNWLEESEYPITITNSGGLASPQSLTIRFETEAGAAQAIPEIRSHFNGSEATERIRLPRVADGAPAYVFSYTVQVGGASGGQSWDWSPVHVWPSSIEVIARYKKLPGDLTSHADDAPVAFPFRIVQKDEWRNEERVGESTTGANGRSLVPIPTPGQVTIEAVSPWEIVEGADQRNSGRRRAFGVRLKPWKAMIHLPTGGKTEDAPHRQWVNLPNTPFNYRDPAGPMLMVAIGPPPSVLSVKNEEIKVRVVFPAENSRRTQRPSRILTMPDQTPIQPISTSGGEVRYEFVARIPEDEDPAAFLVYVGAAGGDHCLIQAGVTDTYEDDVLIIQNWRKIGLELLVPEPRLRQRCTAVLADAGAAFSNDVVTELNTIFERTLIEFEYLRPTTLNERDFTKYWKGRGPVPPFEEDAPIDHPEHLFVPRDKIRIVNSAGGKDPLPANASDTVSLCTHSQFMPLRASKIGGAPPPAVMTWLVTDFIIARSKQDVKGGPFHYKADMSTVKNFCVTTFEGVREKEVELPFHVFEFDPVEANGRFGVLGVTWKSVRYRPAGAGWIPIANPGDPAGAHMNPATVLFGTPAQRNEWCEIVDSRTVKLKLPAVSAGHPGPPVNVSRMEAGHAAPVDYAIAIQVEVEFFGVDFLTHLGGAKNGQGHIQTKGGTVTARFMAQTLAHEIGHNCGQTYTRAENNVVGGWENDPIQGVPFPQLFPAGPYYHEMGHTGSHCASAILATMERMNATEAQRAAAGDGSFDPLSPGIDRYLKRTLWSLHCIMLGVNDPARNDGRAFCTECIKYLRATDLSDVRKDW